MLDTLHYEDFAPHVNGKFLARFSADSTPDSTMEITLISAEDTSPSPRQEQFTLTFLASLEAPTNQGIYELQHEQLGAGELFLVPIAKDQNGVTYEAIFNRKRQAQQ